MVFRTFLILSLLWSAARGFSPNYADQLLDQYAEQVVMLQSQADPVAKVLLAERIFYLGHETSRQERIVDLLDTLYRSTEHQEGRVELAYLLMQQCRHLGLSDRIESLTKELGYVPAWSVLGPLAPGKELNLKKLLAAREVKGLGRNVSAHVLKAYGAQAFWSEGIGQYGFFGANYAIFPNQLAGAVYTTWFQSPARADYRLGLGWSHKARVYVNGSLIFDGTEDQTPHPDQAVIAFNVKKGWHRLTLYIEADTSDPQLGFFARLTDAMGRPLTCDATHKSGVPRSKAKPVEGFEKALTDIAQDRSAYALGSILLTKEQRNHSRHESPADLLRRAYAASPDRVVTEKLISLNTDPNEKWHLLTGYLKGAGIADLDRAWALVQKGQIALGQTRFWEARNYAAEARAAHPGYWPAALVENNALANLDLNGEALRHTLELAKSYPGVPWIMMDLSDLYLAMNFSKENQAQTDVILAIRRSNNKFAERKVETLKRQGDRTGLDAFYRELLRDAPYSVSTTLAYASFLAANQQGERAQSLLEAGLRQLPENPFLLAGLGELKLKSGQQDALVYLERSLAIQPQNPDLEKLIELTKADGGAFYVPYRIAETPDIPVLEVSPIVVNIDNKVHKVAANGQASLYHQLEYEIVSEKGAQELPGYSIAYSPLRQNVEIIRAEIDRAGQIIHLTNFGRARLSDPVYRMYYDLVAYQIPFPTLQVGDLVKIEYRVDETEGFNIFGDYFGDQEYFVTQYPTRRHSFTVIVPKERKLHFHVEKMNPQFKQSEDEKHHIYTWTLDQISPFETESRMPGLEGYLPYVAVSTFDDWQNMARWYADLIRDQLTLDLETKKLVKKLIEGADDRLEIVKRIHEYVITNTRYVALEFGIHGYKPYQVNQICSRQFGDCKDKASLIVALLREAGVPADVAIVRTADKGYVHTYPAMLTYFNHAIAYVPEFDLFLDGTAEFSGIDELPAQDQGALTLIVDAKGSGKLTKIPIGNNSSQGYALEMHLKPNGNAAVSGRVSYTGVDAPMVREYLSIDAKLNQNLQELMADTVPGLDVFEAERGGKRVNDPISLTFSGETRRLTQRGRGEIKIPLSILNAQLTQSYAPNAQRQFPINFGVPKTKSVDLKIEAPDGYVLGNLPSSLNMEDQNFGVSIQLNKEADNILRVNYQLSFKTAQVAPSDYESLRNMMQAHDQVLIQNIQLIER